MKSALSYLLAARQYEIGELERLAGTSKLVGVIGRFTHALQRERGISNIFLASRGERFGAMRLEQVPQCDLLQAQVLESFDALAADPGNVRNGARLFNRIAVVLDGLDGLSQLRGGIGACALAAPEATGAFVRLIAGLLAVVFEAADSAGDPEISRELVAMFHFMQGKEFAGQERAHGAAVFVSGRIDAAGQQQWRHLVEQQHHCFQVFKEFADPSLAAAERAREEHGLLVQIERMRRIGSALGPMPVDESMVDAWYECCTLRLDAMREVEDLVADHLRQLCERKIEEARAALRDQQAALERLHREAGAAPPGTPALIGPQLGRSVLDMVHDQSRRLQKMNDELETVRAALTERKLIERAKGVLMAHRHLSEDEAYRSLRQMAMNQKRRVADVAQVVLSMADMLPVATPSSSR
jgi:hypothetical protein